MTLNLLRIMIDSSFFLCHKVIYMIIRIYWRSQTSLLLCVPSFFIWTGLTSHVISIPNWSIFLANTEVSISGVFLAPFSNIVINSSWGARLAQTGCWVPIRIGLIAIDLNTLVHTQTKGLFEWACLIRLNTKFVLMIPLFSSWTIGYTLLLSYWIFVIEWTRLTL
jgi:hypothetical protein